MNQWADSVATAPSRDAAAISKPRAENPKSDLVLPLLTGSSWASRERSRFFWEQLSCPP